MSDDLLPFYNAELSYIRRVAAQFAEDHPKIAGRLRLGAESSQDPHVERLIEAFAFLTARIRHKLDDEFPEITEAFLGVLYPHYQAPIPSMAIVQFELGREQNQVTTGYAVPRHAQIETEPIQGDPCRFRTCYPTTLWPIDLVSASLDQAPFPAPATAQSPNAAAVLHWTLQCRDREIRFADLALTSLRFFLKGQPQHVYPLYELLFNDALEVVLATGPDDPSPVVLPLDCLRPVGFGRDEGMLPYTARSFMGYRLLTEFFTFPQKFLFVELAGLNPEVLGKFGNRLDVFVFLSRSVVEVERNISADTFQLGCTPVVNLYPWRAEPVQLTHTEHSVRVVPDARRPLAHEVFAIDRVVATSPDGEDLEFLPFFSVKHAASDRATQAFWHAARQPAGRDEEGQIDEGTEVFLSLVDLGFQPSAPADWTLDIETTCLSRDLPHRLPFGGDQPHLQLSEGGALVSRITCLTPPTRTLRPALKRGALWRLISHLSLNHLSLVEKDDKAEALREILKLYDFMDSDDTRRMIDGISDVRSRHITSRVGHGPEAFCRGVEVTLLFDEERFTGTGLFLFASVLERFLGLYCTINSFTKLIARTKGHDEVLRQWPPRMGEKALA